MPVQLWIYDAVMSDPVPDPSPPVMPSCEHEWTDDTHDAHLDHSCIRTPGHESTHVCECGSVADYS